MKAKQSRSASVGSDEAVATPHATVEVGTSPEQEVKKTPSRSQGTSTSLLDQFPRNNWPSLGEAVAAPTKTRSDCREGNKTAWGAVKPAPKPAAPPAKSGGKKRLPLDGANHSNRHTDPHGPQNRQQKGTCNQQPSAAYPTGSPMMPPPLFGQMMPQMPPGGFPMAPMMMSPSTPFPAFPNMRPITPPSAFAQPPASPPTPTTPQSDAMFPAGPPLSPPTLFQTPTTPPVMPSAAPHAFTTVTRPPWSKSAHGYPKNVEAALESELCDYISYVTLTQQEVATRDELIAKVIKIIKSKWPDVEVSIFGSYATDLSLPSSDIDVAVNGLKVNPITAVSELDALLREVKGSPFETKPIPGARIPLIKVRDTVSGVHLDLSFNAMFAKEAVELVRKRMVSPSQRFTVMAVKSLIRDHKFNDVYRGGLPSFAIYLMVMHLSNVHPHADVMQPGRFLLEFLTFYGGVFDYVNSGICFNPDGTSYQIPKPPWIAKDNPHMLLLTSPFDSELWVAASTSRMHDIKLLFWQSFASLYGLGVLFHAQRIDAPIVSMIKQCYSGDPRSAEEAPIPPIVYPPPVMFPKETMTDASSPIVCDVSCGTSDFMRDVATATDVVNQYNMATEANMKRSQLEDEEYLVYLRKRTLMKRKKGSERDKAKKAKDKEAKGGEDGHRSVGTDTDGTSTKPKKKKGSHTPSATDALTQTVECVQVSDKEPVVAGEVPTTTPTPAASAADPPGRSCEASAEA